MRIGLAVFSANKDADLSLKANAPAVAAESLMNWRRVLFISLATFLVIPSEVEESLAACPKGVEMSRLRST
jgi:hypothetical protein